MSHDLRRELHDLSKSERPFLDDLPIALLQERARRRRVQRAATYSAIGAATVAVLAFGGIAGASALRHRAADPALPDAPAPTPTASTNSPAPAPTPTASPTATPTATDAVWAPSWDACAQKIAEGSFAGTDDAGNYWWSSTTVDWQISPNVGEPFELGLQLSSTSAQAQTVQVRLVDVWATRFDQDTFTWNVVGVASRPLGNLSEGVLPASDTATYVPLPLAPAEVQIASCASAPGAGGDGALDIPLADGEYELVVRTDVTKADGTTQQVYSLVGALGESPPQPEPGAAPTDETTSSAPSVDEPFHLAPGVPLRLGTALTTNNATMSGTDQMSFCGKDVAGVTPTPNTPQTRATLSATAFLADGELVVQMTTTNTGPALAGADIGLPMAYIARDGRLVGLVQNPTSYFAIDQWPAAGSVQYELAVGRFTCTFMLGEPWPAGTYDVIYQQSLGPGDGTAFDMSGRSTFTIS